jgi:hypothetical protein
MARSLPKLDERVMVEIEAGWSHPQEEWARRLLLVMRLIAQHELTVAEIMRIADGCRQTMFVYRDKVVAAGMAGLLKRGKAPGKRPASARCRRSSSGGWRRGSSSRRGMPKLGCRSASSVSLARAGCAKCSAV